MTGRRRSASRHSVVLLAVLQLTAVLLVAGCGAQEPLALAPPSPTVALVASPTPPAHPSSGEVAVAYPEQPSAWHVPDGSDPAATDLAALWGLPFYRIGPGGALRPALVEEATTGPGSSGGWQVTLRLRSGRWSDGTPVVAEDVVATIDALRDSGLSGEFSALRAATALDGHTVRLDFDHPYGRWPYLLSGGRSVLPAHVLQTGGLGAYRDGLPVTGGPFRLVEQHPGLDATFEAWPGSPLGAPRLARVRVLVTPDFETALGLLERDRVQVALGYLALNPVERATKIPGVAAAAPLGGSWVGLDWHADGVLGGASRTAVRRRVADAVELSQLREGLLGPIGAPATSVIPGVELPAADRTPADLRGVTPPVLVVSRWQEATAYTGRAVERQLRAAGGGLDLYPLGTPELVEASRADQDGALRVFRATPRPALVTMSRGDDALMAAADAAPTRRDEVVLRALAAIRADASMVPLYRIGVTHAWRGVAGIRPSSWPGLAFWDVGEWALQAGGPPRAGPSVPPPTGPSPGTSTGR